jgi:hypothetical protein
MTQPLIWAVDVATTTGIAVGRAGGTPVAKSFRLVPPGATSNALFLAAVEWFGGLLDHGPLPDILAIEELLPPTARRGETNTQTQHRLAGLHGIIRGLAGQRGIAEIIGVNVGLVRAHFIHTRALPGPVAKRRVLDTCKALGWSASDNNAGDALALWSYTAATLHPASGLRTTPLFGSWEELAAAREVKA